MLKAINPFLLLETANKIIIIISAKYQIRVIRCLDRETDTILLPYKERLCKCRRRNAVSTLSDAIGFNP